MIPHYVDQGSPEWWALKLGVPSASNFHKIISPKKMEPSAQAGDYMLRLIAEKILKESTDDQLKIEWAERGKVEQPHAAQAFEFLTDLKLKPIGFITTDDGRLGCSPDYLIADHPQAVEIKCPAPWTHLGYLLNGLDDNYRPQVQGQLLIGGFDMVHFYSYHPQLPGRHIGTVVDRGFQPKLVAALYVFLERLDRAFERAVALGCRVVSTPAARPLERAYPDTGDHEPPLQLEVPDAGGRDNVTILDAG
jgi:hypothetical protein